MNIKWIGAHPNNFGVGRSGKTIDKVVMHWIVGTLALADATFNSPTRIASSHYGVGPNEIHQYVKEEDTAWHAGNLTVNKESIGIEHEGGPNLPIQEQTIKNSAELLAQVCKKYNIPIDRNHIKLHKEIKPTQCPGTLDVDRIISLAKEINAQPVPEPIITNPQAKLGLVAPYGVQELQAVNSILIAKDAKIKELEDKISKARVILA